MSRRWGAVNAFDCAQKASFTEWSRAAHAAHYSQQLAARDGIIFVVYRCKRCARYHVGASRPMRNDTARKSLRPKSDERGAVDPCDLRRIRTLDDALSLDESA